MMEIKNRFDKYQDEFLKFDRIEHNGEPLSRRPDVYAFLLLDLILLPPVKSEKHGAAPDMISCAEHDEIWLDVNVEALNEAATDAQIRDLVRCGVMYDSSVESLRMYV